MDTVSEQPQPEGAVCTEAGTDENESIRADENIRAEDFDIASVIKMMESITIPDPPRYSRPIYTDPAAELFDAERGFWSSDGIWYDAEPSEHSDYDNTTPAPTPTEDMRKLYNMVADCRDTVDIAMDTVDDRISRMQMSMRRMEKQIFDDLAVLTHEAKSNRAKLNAIHRVLLRTEEANTAVAGAMCALLQARHAPACNIQ